jgi:hypothetical protein
MRSIVRDAMIYHTRGIADPATRVAQAREVLEFLAESVKDDPSAYASTLRAEADHLRTQGDYYVLHDHLEIVNEPVYFHEFIEGATRQGTRLPRRSRFCRDARTRLASRSRRRSRVARTC